MLETIIWTVKRVPSIGSPQCESCTSSHLPVSANCKCALFNVNVEGTIHRGMPVHCQRVLNARLSFVLLYWNKAKCLTIEQHTSDRLPILHN